MPVSLGRVSCGDAVGSPQPCEHQRKDASFHSVEQLFPAVFKRMWWLPDRAHGSSPSSWESEGYGCACRSRLCSGLKSLLANAGALGRAVPLRGH